MALTMLFLVLQGTQVVETGKRRWIDPHWHRGMSYLKLGWNWVRLAMTRQWHIHRCLFLDCAPDPHPAQASKKQSLLFLRHEFVVLRHLPAF